MLIQQHFSAWQALQFAPIRRAELLGYLYFFYFSFSLKYSPFSPFCFFCVFRLLGSIFLVRAWDFFWGILSLLWMLFGVRLVHEVPQATFGCDALPTYIRSPPSEFHCFNIILVRSGPVGFLPHRLSTTDLFLLWGSLGCSLWECYLKSFFYRFC